MPERFHTTILQSDKTATGIVIPNDIVLALGAGKKPPVSVTLNGYTYRSTIATINGRFMVGVSADVRAASGLKGGDEVDVTIDVDTAPREVTLPDDFAARLEQAPKAKATFDGLSYSLRKYHVDLINGAKSSDTRQRRLDKAIKTLNAGRPR